MPTVGDDSAPASGDDPARLSRRAAAGDRAGFDEAAAGLRWGIVRVFAARGVEAAMAEDLAQRTLLAAWKACAAGKYDPSRAALSTFMYAVANNIWMQHLREAGRVDAYARAVEHVGEVADPADAVRLAEAIQAVRGALDGRVGGLSEQERWILRQAATGETDRGIARALGISASTAHQARQGAYGKLRRVLSRLGLGSESSERGGGGSE